MTKANASVWAAYERAQKHADRSRIDPLYWSADETADHILTLAEAGVASISAQAVERMARNWRRNLAATARRRAAILATHYAPLQDTAAASPEDGTAAVLELERIRRLTSDAEWDLLQRVGVGETQGEIAEAIGVSEKAVELRVARLRRRLAG